MSEFLSESERHAEGVLSRDTDVPGIVAALQRLLDLENLIDFEEDLA